ncbi:type II toxin-antitoxin system VapC family toxin, partial [Calditrichota bacterium]
MNGNNYLIDTNIAIYLLSGDQRIAELLHSNNIFLSFITELELQGFKKLSKSEYKTITDFLNNCTIIDINKSIKDNTINLRKKYNIKLPDCIIAAT